MRNKHKLRLKLKGDAFVFRKISNKITKECIGKDKNTSLTKYWSLEEMVSLALTSFFCTFF